jgi:TPP-dependent pyruvate/acetoin dehydrogenase alpha subunit
MDDTTRRAVLHKAVLARRLEARVVALAKAGMLPATLHLGTGQEVAQIAALEALRPDDPMLYGHRGVGYWIARGVEPEVILCDIGYREGGSNRGKGGPMHVVDVARGVLGETGSLGGNLVIGVGIAFAEAQLATGRVAIVFFGDGTANRGQFHEALNFASLRALPVIFFCENNGWGLSNPTSASTAVADIATRAAGYSMPGVIVDGNDADAVFAAVATAAVRARSGQGPTLIEAKVQRIHAHYLGDREQYRTDIDRDEARRRDPLDALMARCSGAELDRIETDVAARIDEAVAFFERQPMVAAATALESVYAR